MWRKRLKLLGTGIGIVFLSGCVAQREPVVVYRQAPPMVVSGPPQVVTAPAQSPVVVTAPPPQFVPQGNSVWTNAQPNQGSTPVPPPQAAPVYQAPQIAAQAPPPFPVETLPPSPGVDYVWVRGYWTWGGVGWVWAPGRWMFPPRPRAAWVPGVWIYDGHHHHYRWSPGHWR